MNWSHLTLIIGNPGDNAWWYNGNGWYFADECTQLIGPYPSRLEAHMQYESYCKYLNSQQYSYAGE